MTDLQPAPPTRKHPNRPFAIATIILVLLFLAGLASMAVWMARDMGEFNPQAILSRITGREIILQLTDMTKGEVEQVVTQAATLSTQTSQVEETAVAVITDDQPTAEPTPGVIQTTRTPIPTPMPTTTVAVATEVAVAATEAPLDTSDSSTETTTDQSTASSSGSTTETASETSTGSTQTPATSELPDTGFMDELGLPILAMLGVILFLAILLVKYLRTSL